MSQRWALLLQYDGTEFAGSQWQPNRPTVQSALQAAIASLSGATTSISMAGRTDAGVHATGQVASFVSEISADTMPARRWIRGLNHFLPDSVAVQAATAVSDDFDPRRDAVSRTYEYELRLSNQRQPLWTRRAWIVPPPFCSDAARDALSALVGEHDMAAFTPPSEQRSTIRHMFQASLSESSDTALLRFRADAFLQHQVRRMVGTVAEVARGRLPLHLFKRDFARAAPGSMGPTAPPQGLTLREVMYDPPLFSSTNMGNIVDSACCRARVHEGV